MLSEKINNVLNKQINKEFYSAYLYLSVGAHFHTSGLHGFAKWCKTQAQEEVEHGMIIFNFINEVKGKIELFQINPPDITFQTPIEAFENILEHEKYVTDAINKIAILTEEECDNMTRQFIDSFVCEQREEICSVNAILDTLKAFGDSKSVMYHLDKELGMREQ